MAKDTLTILRASELVEDFGLYPRADVDSYHVGILAEAIRAGAQLPPIVADLESKRIIDGFHRRRAHAKVHGPDCQVTTILRAYGSEAEMFLAAVAANAAHGRMLTTYDKVRCLSMADQLHVERASVVDALHLTRERAEELTERRSAEGEPLKRTLAHFAGEPLTVPQREFNRRSAGGMAPLFYVNQVIRLLETESLDLERPAVQSAVARLRELLAQVLVAA